MEPLYFLKDVEKKRSGDFTLRVERLELYPGRIYTLCGPNGAGKSTLLDLLAFLSFPDRGEFFFAGERVRGDGRWLQEKRQQVTLVQQAPFLFDGTVAKNVAFGLKVRGVVGRKQRERLLAALREVGLEGFERRRARGLSGGEAQRVAIARALALRPRVLLLDEPTASIDLEHIRSLERLLPLLAGEGIGVIMASHDRELARRLESEIVPLAGGRLQREAPTLSV